MTSYDLNPTMENNKRDFPLINYIMAVLWCWLNVFDSNFFILNYQFYFC